MASTSFSIEILNKALKDRKLFDEELLELVTLCKMGNKTLLTMTMNILDMSRLEENKFPLHFVESNIVEIISLVLSDYKYIILNSNIVCSIPDEQCIAEADFEIIRRVISNIVSNSLRFMQSGGRLDFAIEIDSGFVTMSIRDTGPGIPQSDLERVFSKFGQVENMNRHNYFCAGLGLTFCKLAIEAHGGSIGVRSKEGEGATFWFSIPLKQKIDSYC